MTDTLHGCNWALGPGHIPVPMARWPLAGNPHAMAAAAVVSTAAATANSRGTADAFRAGSSGAGTTGRRRYGRGAVLEEGMTARARVRLRTSMGQGRAA